MIQILKVRAKKTSVSIKAQVDGDTLTVEASSQPAEAFIKAFDDLVPVALDILDIDRGWKEGVRVTGLTVTPVGEENAKITLVARKDFTNGSPFNICVPYRFLTEPEQKEGDESDPSAISLTDKQRKAVDRLLMESEKYIKGLNSMAKAFGQLELGLSGGGAIQEGESGGEPESEPNNKVDFPAKREGKAKRGRKPRTVATPPATVTPITAGQPAADAPQQEAATGR